MFISTSAAEIFFHPPAGEALRIDALPAIISRASADSTFLNLFSLQDFLLSIFLC